ncbi:MAG TPA: hypothetical protein VFV38_23450 [Ktedonobacteraceae bacterium]|nr:hypothetical protein [Ktedonobacteraceae bacterium]
MGKLQKVSTKACKEEVVRLAQTAGKPIAQVAREASSFPGSLAWTYLTDTRIAGSQKSQAYMFYIINY